MLLGAISCVANQMLWVSVSPACVLAEIALGSLGAGLLHLDPAASTPGAGMRLLPVLLRQNWCGLAVTLGPGMVLMWAAGVAIPWAGPPWPFIALAVGASVLAHGVTGTPPIRPLGGTPPPDDDERKPSYVG